MNGNICKKIHTSIDTLLYAKIEEWMTNDLISFSRVNRQHFATC